MSICCFTSLPKHVTKLWLKIYHHRNQPNRTSFYSHNANAYCVEQNKKRWEKKPCTSLYDVTSSKSRKGKREKKHTYVLCILYTANKHKDDTRSSCFNLYSCQNNSTLTRKFKYEKTGVFSVIITFMTWHYYMPAIFWHKIKRGVVFHLLHRLKRLNL